MELKIASCRRIKGTIKVPGDKSISHRALLIGCLAQGEVQVRNFLLAEDCLNTVECLQALGVRIDQSRSDFLVVNGVGFSGLRQAEDVLYVGNSGTTIRILSGILAGQPFTSVVDGDDSIRRRPMDRIIIPLKAMGARIEARDGRFAPLRIEGGHLKGISYATPVPSAQVKTALLLAGLLAEGKTVVKERASSRDHSERMLEFLGADITRKDNTIEITGDRPLFGGKIDVPGDLSSAMYLIVGTLILSDSEISLKSVGANPSRSGLLTVLKKMEANVELFNQWEASNEPRADIVVRSSKLRAVSVEGEIIPRLIDELPVLAVAATQAEGETVVRGARELRVKESDRIAAIVTELRRLGAEIEELEDGFIVKGPTQLKGTVCQSYGDHRIALSLAIAGLVAEGETVIKDAECITTSFPNFEQVLKSVIK